MTLKKHNKHSGRKIVTPSKTTIRSLRRVIKGGYVQQHESLLQSKWALVLDWDRKVVEFPEEPLMKSIRGGGKAFKYFPDFEVVKDDGSVDCVEIKPYRYAIKPDIAMKHTLIADHLSSEGHDFRVLTEKELPEKAIVFSNMRYLKWFVLTGTKSRDELSAFVPSTPISFKDLAKECGCSQIVMEMLGHQLAYVDLTKPIGEDTIVRKIEEEDHAKYY